MVWVGNPSSGQILFRSIQTKEAIESNLTYRRRDQTGWKIVSKK